MKIRSVYYGRNTLKCPENSGDRVWKLPTRIATPGGFVRGSNDTQVVSSIYSVIENLLLRLRSAVKIRENPIYCEALRASVTGYMIYYLCICAMQSASYQASKNPDAGPLFLSFVLLEALRRKGCTAVPLVRHGDPALSSVDAFFLALGLLYDEPNSVDQAEKNLLALCQGQDDIEVYCQKFRKWSVLTQWNESALAALFRKGLSEALKDVMVGFPMPAGLNESLSLAIQIGRRLRERKSVHHLVVLPEVKPEPMKCDRTMTRVERQEYRRLNGLCFYCGDSTHAISDCPKRTKRSARSAVIGTVQSKFLLSITLICSLSSYSVMAFVDSGAALNLMDLDYAKRCGFFLEPLRCPIPLRGIDATPLAKNKPQYWAQLTMCMAPAHQEVIRFLVLHNLHDVVVLGLPWLQTHNPVLDWNSMSVSSWGCQGVHGDVPFLSISSSTPSEVPEFLSDYQDVFEEPKSDALPPHRDCDCAINLIPDSKFPKGRLFNLSVPEHAAMRSYVKESLEKGHIRPSSSPLGAGFFFVAKKDGSLRPCIDYRLLNKITVKFQYPLPLLSDLFARIKGASWFTKIDLRGAYNLVRIRQGDEWKTAFNTPEGHFEYLVMPFGLANAPSVFQSFMHDIFREYLDKFLIVYLDDILIFSDDWESHVKQVRMVFQVLRANSLFVKGSKCLFGVQKVSFLGFIFTPSTIEMDPVKVQAIQDWIQPTSLKSLQKFLGFANFYRRFICNFSSIAKPLTDLTKKGADLVNWSSAAVEAFQELKRRFCSAPVLCQPDVSLPFQVEVDASEIGAGAVLSQRGSDCSVMKPCAFFSRKFSPAERNYDLGNRELLAMKWAFEEWRHWLEGAKHRVVVLTDHKNLTYLESAKRLNPRQARWSLFFARFDFVISYLPGSKNVKADALSRSFVPDSPGLSEPAGILKEGVIVSAISPDLRRVLQKFQANKPDRCPAEKLFVPDRWTNKLISELHCSVLAGHPGIFDQDDWVSFLPLAEFALNNRASSATLVSPFFCNSWFHPRFSSGQVESSDCPGVDSVVDRLQQIWTQRPNIESAPTHPGRRGARRAAAPASRKCLRTAARSSRGVSPYGGSMGLEKEKADARIFMDEDEFNRSSAPMLAEKSYDSEPDRDPHDLNGHLKLSFEDVIAEPDSTHSFDKVWICSTALFEISKYLIYKLLTVLLAIPLAFVLGLLFAILSCLHIWDALHKSPGMTSLSRDRDITKVLCVKHPWERNVSGATLRRSGAVGRVVMPFVRTSLMLLPSVQAVWRGLTDSFVAPLFASMGRCFSTVSVRVDQPF
ncbi:unnamed protein product [Ranitomeya imitator]|uniref:Reverse transcriptase n=1 Tax=Ranitomeya imitator TaxID=111125 RepID=A0ABN9MPT6_9NEOB|nr:unnamed protein product [Ranitomeya imitator]